MPSRVFARELNNIFTLVNAINVSLALVCLPALDLGAKVELAITGSQLGLKVVYCKNAIASSDVSQVFAPKPLRQRELAASSLTHRAHSLLGGSELEGRGWEAMRIDYWLGTRRAPTLFPSFTATLPSASDLYRLKIRIVGYCSQACRQPPWQQQVFSETELASSTCKFHIIDTRRGLDITVLTILLYRHTILSLILMCSRV